VDSGAGGCPSPIWQGRCLSLPIPAPRAYPSAVTYGALGLPAPVELLSEGRLRGDQGCHPDPAFHDGRAALGQVDAAQSHLAGQGVGPGDLFLFFGLFSTAGDRHHRIFGYLSVEEVCHLGPAPRPDPLIGLPWPHPHTTAAPWPANNTVYLGTGATAAPAHPELRLTRPGGPLTRWQVPAWLADFRLTYHAAPWRWAEPGLLASVARGQEFVADVGQDGRALAWAAHLVALIRSGPDAALPQA
jgi:hypothetical protein